MLWKPGMITPIAQQHDQATYAPKLQKSDSRIDWQLPAIEIDRRIRAMTPKPGAWTTMALSEHEISLSIGPVSPNRDIQLDPGVICVIDKNVFVGARHMPLNLIALNHRARNSCWPQIGCVDCARMG